MKNVIPICHLLLCLGIGLLLSTASSFANTAPYDYPITDRFVSTVVGTPSQFQADLPHSMPLTKRRLRVFPERKVPDVLWYARDLLYSVALQSKPAPLIYIIAGTGGGHDGEKNRVMAKAFFQAGFHVVSLSSPTYPNFVVAASSTGVVGHSEKDAADLYRVMEMIWAGLRAEIDVTAFHLSGYSLGGFNSAFVSKLDEQRGVFNFDKVLMINPPVSLYNSVSILDRMTENIPGGVDNFNQFAGQLMNGLTQIYTQTDDVFANDILYRGYQALGLKDEQLAALIGTSFRLSSASLVFAADIMADFGYIKPRGLVLDRNSDLTQYDGLATRLNFTDYYHEFFYPYYREEYPQFSRDEFISAISLQSITPYLRKTQKISLMHNADDVILSRGDIDYLTEVFGGRAKIYPYGGHCGNLAHRDNIDHMLNVFNASLAP
ncbi:MAG: hypothetical protein AB8C02_05385 [Halioglobus sp.]